MVVFDGASLFIALPTLSGAFSVGAADIVLPVLIYQVVVLASLLPIAAVGEWIGYRRIHLAGLSLFAAASLLAAMAPGFAVLCAARAAQGIGAAATMAIHGAILRHIFSSSRFGTAVGLTTFVVATTGAATPFLATNILQFGGWHWLFLVNVPLGLAALTLGAAGLPKERGERHHFDVASAVLVGLAATLLVIAVDVGGRIPFYAAALVVLLSLAAGAALLIRQRNHARPMLPVDLLRLPDFAGSVVAAVLGFAAQTLAFVVLPFFFQRQLGMTALAAGILLTAWPVATAPVAVFAGRLTNRFNPGSLGGVGMLIFVIAAVGLGFAIDRSEPNLIVAGGLLLACGLGFGLFQAPNNKVMLSSAPRSRAAAASGMQAFSRLLGQALGAATAAIFLASDSASLNVAALFIAACAGACAGLAAVLPAKLLHRTRLS
jgi:DHA2 family multidrug resistance protein-like MFS transporter